MANLFQNSETKATQAPSYFNDYLSNIASAGQSAQKQAQYVGAQPLQNKAFDAIGQNFGAQQPAFQAGQNLMGQAAGQNITGAVSPYLQAATGQSTSPLSAMQPYANEAMRTSGYCASIPLVGQGAGLSGLSAASPFLGRAAGTGGACASAGYVNQATKLDSMGSASPYLQQAAARGGLCAATSYLQQGVGTDITGAADPYLRAASTNDPSKMAESYMSPYIKNAVQTMSDIGQRNIRQNLSPAATSAAVGSGQFGSQRGAQVMGQIQAQAEQDLNSQISQMLNSGYGQALSAAGQQQALLGQLGQTAGSLASQEGQQALTAGQTAGTLSQQQQNLLGQLGSTAGNLTTSQIQNLINAGNVQGTLTQQQQNLLGQLGGTAGSLTNQQAQNLITGGLGLGTQKTNANQIAAGLGQTAASAQGAANTAQIQAAQTAGCAAAKQAAALYQSGMGMGSLGQQAANTNIACINAMATLGGQQQTIAQNQQMFPLTSLSKLAELLQGYQVPTSTTTTMCMSPFSALGAIGSGALGMLQPTNGTGGAGTGPSTLQNAINTIKGIYNNFQYTPGGSTGSNSPDNIDVGGGWNPWFGCGSYESPSYSGCSYCAYDFQGNARGGHIQAKANGGAIGCGYTINGGAIPQGFCESVCVTCTPYAAQGGLVGATGCVSTQNFGGMPLRGKP